MIKAEWTNKDALDLQQTCNQLATDLISRQDALDILDELEADIEIGKKDAYKMHREKLLSIHSAYHPLCALADRECPFQGKEFAWCLTCPHIGEEDRELVKKAVAEPKTINETNANKIYSYLKERIDDTVDDMKEFDAWFERMVWHVKECDRLAKEPKTGKWVYDPNGMDWNIPAWRCSECGYVAPHIGIADKGIGSNPMNWAGSKYCPECGCKIVGAKMRGEEE